ncbi:MAG: InlB B-repeat-containing protein, partial [Fibrobacter sp.]|nr:InlB B-repeat-containing protein [Fibrobacter sp.]
MKKNYRLVLTALFVLLFSNLSFAENEDPCAMPTTLTKIDEVYQIGTCGDLYKFAEMVNNSEFDDNINGKLTDDICVNACGEGESVLNADGTLNGNGGSFKQWTPMNFLPGYGMFDVQVTLDGNGKTISGLYFDDISTENVGLFGVVTGMVFVSDLGIEDSYFRGEGFVGGLVGLNTSTGTFSITNSYNAGTVIGSDYVGGLVGYSSGTLTITNSYNAGTMNGDGDNVGGLVGYIFYSTLTITNSFFLAAEGVSGEFGGTPKSANEFHIGLVALMLHNYVQTGCGNDCIDGSIWGQDLKKGDLRPNFSSVINVETQELVLHTFEDDTRVYPTEYIAGQELPTDLTREGFVFLGWSSKEVAESSDDIVTSIASDATGKKEFYAQWKAFDDDGCFAIASTVELYAFANVVNNATEGEVCGTLAENIVVNTCDDGKSVLKGDGSLNCSGEKFKQWTPMNVQSGVQVTFNGKGKTISGLYFDNGNKENVGLFGGVYGTVDISNLNIVDSYFKGKNGVGGLVGYSSGTLTITNSYNAGSVSGSKDNVGGLVGCGMRDALTITSSYNAGAVAGRYDVGGLVGFNDGGTLTVTNSYNVGGVSGSEDNVGGLVGANEYFSTLTITNSYNVGAVSGRGVYVGGLVGLNYEGTLTITNSFFLAAGKSGDGLGGELKALDDFHDGTVAMLLHYYVQTDCEEDCIDGTVWGQDLTNANSLPDFSGEFAGGTLHALTLYTFDGNVRKYPTEYVSEIGFELPKDLTRKNYVFAGWSTKQVSTSMADIVTSIAKGATGAKTFYAQWMKVSEEGVYEIATAADLYKFAQLVNGGATDINGKLTADICVNACGEGESVLKADGTLNGDGSNFSQWIPIGTKTQKFNGTFDGTGHTISGLYVDGAEYAGLFGYVFVDNINGEDEKGVVKNVGIEDSHISGTKYVGGVVAYNEGRTLSVYNAGNVTGSGSGCATGGVVGYNVGLVSDAYNAGAVKSSVNDCSTGGVVGLNAGFVFYVYNIGAVSGGANVGGVAGSNSSMISKAYYNTEIFTGNAVGSGNLPNPAAGKTAVELSSLEIVDLVSDKDHVGSSAWVAGSGRIVMSANKLVYKLPGLKVFSTQPEIVLMQANDQNVFEIGSAQELKWFAEYAGSGEISINAKLTANICLNACGEGKSVLKADGTLNGDAANFEQWTPINIASMNTNMSLDGNGHTISGLYFRNADKDSVGFFGSLQGTVSISNLGIEDSYIEGKDNVGVFVGVNDNS